MNNDRVQGTPTISNPLGGELEMLFCFHSASNEGKRLFLTNESQSIQELRNYNEFWQFQ